MRLHTYMLLLMRFMHKQLIFMKMTTRCLMSIKLWRKLRTPCCCSWLRRIRKFKDYWFANRTLKKMSLDCRIVRWKLWSFPTHLLIIVSRLVLSMWMYLFHHILYCLPMFLFLLDLKNTLHVLVLDCWEK